MISASSCIDWNNDMGTLFNRLRCFGSVFRGGNGSGPGLGVNDVLIGLTIVAVWTSNRVLDTPVERV